MRQQIGCLGSSVAAIGHIALRSSGQWTAFGSNEFLNAGAMFSKDSSKANRAAGPANIGSGKKAQGDRAAAAT